MFKWKPFIEGLSGIYCNLSLIPRPPLFLPFVFTVIHESQDWRNVGKAWEHWSCELRQVDARWTCWLGGGEDQLPKQCTGSSILALYCSFGLQTLAWIKILIKKKVKKLLSSFVRTYLNIPPCPPHVQLCDECSQPIPVFLLSSIIVNANGR